MIFLIDLKCSKCNYFQKDVDKKQYNEDLSNLIYYMCPKCKKNLEPITWKQNNSGQTTGKLGSWGNNE